MSPAVEPTMTKRLAAEVLGTFWLVFAGCGAAVIASGVVEQRLPQSGSALPVSPWRSV